MRTFIIAPDSAAAKSYCKIHEVYYDYITKPQLLRGLKKGRLIVLPGAYLQPDYDMILQEAKLAKFTIDMIKEKEDEN